MKYRTVAALASAVATTFGASSVRADLSDVLGAAHIQGQYYFGTEDYPSQGADQVLASGSKVIKLEMDSQYASKYAWNTPSWGTINSLTDLAKTSYFQSVFSKPFDTYVITTYSIGIPNGGDGTEYWLNGMSAAQKTAEQASFYNLAKYLMTTYNGTGKTFSLENWEGDWALRDGAGHTAGKHDGTPTQAEAQGMIDWFNAREAGIQQARAELAGKTDVNVYGTVEVNRVVDAEQNKELTVTNNVLPFTDVDYASYSSYDTQQVTGTGSTSFSTAVNYIAQHLPSTAVHGQNTHSVYVGEFGLAEDTAGSAAVNSMMNNVINTVQADGMPYALYWEVYSNELKAGQTGPVNGNDAAVNGFYFVKPDGTPATAWHQYRQRIITSDPTRATTTPIKTGLTDVYQNNFNNNGGSLSSSYWALTGSGVGSVTTSVNNSRFEMQFTGNVTSIPYVEETLNLNNVIGRGLKVGEYLEFSIQRENDAGIIGVGAFGLHHGSAIASGTSSPLEVWPGSAWVPFSTGANGSTVNYNFDTTHTLGMRLDSADGNFATVSYYMDGAYAGSWLYKTSATTMTSFNLFAQDSVANAGFSFDNLSVYAAATPGDANMNGVVDASDFTALSQHFGSTSSVWMNGDFNNDGIVNALDFNILASHFGQSFAAPALGSVVPEPSMALLAATICLPILSGRRKRT